MTGPQNAWLIGEKPTKMDDLGVLVSRGEIPVISGFHHSCRAWICLNATEHHYHAAVLDTVAEVSSHRPFFDWWLTCGTVFFPGLPRKAIPNFVELLNPRAGLSENMVLRSF